MTTSFVVVDDFLGNPHDVRKAALEMEYPSPGGATAYAGVNSRQRLSLPGLDEAVTRLVGERVRPTPNSFHAMCRLAYADSEGRNEVHVDPGRWSGILYLSLPEDCTGGTEFYRHVATGCEGVPMTRAEQDRLGMRSFEDVLERIIKPDANDPTKWEPVMRIPMRFNRLVLFRPWLWHNAGTGFGTTPEHARLVYLLFFDGAA